MNSRLALNSLFAFALTLQIPSHANACRIGWDQHLFEQSPPANALPGAQIIRVRFSNDRAALDRWPRHVAGPGRDTLGYTLIGVARRLDRGASGAETFPVYSIVTSCSGFWPMNFDEARTVVEGDYYLIGRFALDERRAFYAGGRRMDGGGDLYGGWHF